MMQTSKCISLQIMHYGTRVLAHNIELSKKLRIDKPLLIDNLPHNQNLCEKE